MQVIEKNKLFKAMKIVLREYKKGTHRAHLNNCSLCKLYNKSEDEKHRGHECRLCPMHVFHRQGGTSYSCMNRNCTPFTSNDGESVNEIKRVTEFYKQAIKVVEFMSEEELNKKNAFKFLVKIDNEIYWKYS